MMLLSDFLRAGSDVCRGNRHKRSGSGIENDAIEKCNFFGWKNSVR